VAHVDQAGRDSRVVRSGEQSVLMFSFFRLFLFLSLFHTYTAWQLAEAQDLLFEAKMVAEAHADTSALNSIALIEVQVLLNLSISLPSDGTFTLLSLSLAPVLGAPELPCGHARARARASQRLPALACRPLLLVTVHRQHHRMHAKHNRLGRYAIRRQRFGTGAAWRVVSCTDRSVHGKPRGERVQWADGGEVCDSQAAVVSGEVHGEW
jgi:hypothetical protein